MKADPSPAAPASQPGNSRLPEWLKNALPGRESLATHPWLKPVAHRVLDPQLWRLQHEAVARGVAIGIFWAFAIPVAQFVMSTLHCVWWRANIPVAAAMTLVTNPFTIGFWLWLAYKTGSLVLDAAPPVALEGGAGVLAMVGSFGAPALLGMAIFAVGGALAGYLSVKLAWRLQVNVRRWKRLKSSRSAPLPPAG